MVGLGLPPVQLVPARQTKRPPPPPQVQSRITVIHLLAEFILSENHKFKIYHPIFNLRLLSVNSTHIIMRIEAVPMAEKVLSPARFFADRLASGAKLMKEGRAE